MNKKVIFVSALIFLVVIATLFFVIQYNMENNPDYLQKYCESWSEKKEVFRPACVGEWVREEGQCIWKCEISDDSLIGGCAGVALESRQECCNNWATENEIVHAMCVGEWIINENNSCAWECFEE